MPLAELSVEVGQWIREDLPDRPILGVTHSMGGIIARHLRDVLPWQGVVMLAPPNQGSQVVSHMRQSRLFRWYFGPAGQQLGDPGDWPPPPHPTAVIAGTRGPSIGNPPSWVTSGFSMLDPDEPHDGTLALSETQHNDIVDFATVEASHTWIMDHPRTQELVVHFLRYKRLGTAPE
jgi:triacylglycerol esterase/lipase EstA (alpha/beta hydrolase family)